MRPCAIIPAYQAARTVAEVVGATRALWPEPSAVFVVDDGSTDGTADLARAAGATVLAHPNNRGKGAALRTGMMHALRRGFDVAVTLDADAQHPPAEAHRIAFVDPDPRALVLGVRDLVRAGAPRANQMSNRISNFFLSLFSGRPLADTQCGLRRYPLQTTLSLGARDDGYAFEAEIILRAIAAGVRIVEVPMDVVYPPEHERITHFHSVRDPARIVFRVVSTLAESRLAPATIPPVTPSVPSAKPSRPSRDTPRESAREL
ncbi:glycosyltransferase family 2 protein [Polyangium fumosum]|uniref:Glycosyltransferase family 2 protein n=1 Tax=Polyangium fumosum TaxID=889272 RepID=A0A4U1JJJ9_9BACT|nr:glycosyltransferase family 2 protein [Polyangium fumosum]TKD12879.1 glycosyltransferase family 2 protein [Polyangium fumosum]